MLAFLIPSLVIGAFGLFSIFGIRPDLFLNQIVYFSIGVAVYFVVRKIGRNFFALNSSFFYWFFFITLLFTFIIGLEVRGSRRWIDFYFLRFQASEFFKIFFILHLSQLLANRPGYINGAKLFLKSLLYFTAPVLIVFKQPDLGNALVYFVAYFSILLFSSMPKRYIGHMLAFIGLTLPGTWFFLKNYQRERILSFFNPHLDRQGTSYNMIQSVITVGSGRFFGRGLGLGTQSRLYFLPENHTDFAFASLVEQFGFFGGAIVIGLFFVIIFGLIKKLLEYYYRRDEESESRLLFVGGFLSYFAFQIVVNIGMNMGMLPVTGIALPLISYGGSSLLAFMIGLALLP